MKIDSLRICLVSGELPSPKAGGVGTVVDILDAQLRRQGASTAIVCTSSSRDSRPNTYFMGGKGFGPLHHLTFGTAFVLNFGQKLSEFDVIQYHLPNAIGPLALSPYSLRHKTVATFHTTFAGYRRNLYERVPSTDLTARDWAYKLVYLRLLERMEGRAISKAGTLTAVASHIKQELVRDYEIPEPVVIANGIDAEQATHQTDSDTRDTPIVLFVGRLAIQKGLRYAMNALDLVQEPFELQIAGTGNLETQLRRLAETKKFPTRFLGFKRYEEVRRLYAAADVFLLPSYYEGMPMAGLEAAAAGLPIAGTVSAGISDFVSDENRALLVQPGDTRGLAASLNLLLSEKIRRDRIGQHNANKVRSTFRASDMVNGYVSVFGDLN